MTPPEPRFGKYLLLSKIASGGMAVAYRAEMSGAAGVKKRVVLKVIHPQLAVQKDFVEMFVREARVAASLTHSNIAQVFDFGEIGGRYYLSMEEVIGQPLSKIIKVAREKGYPVMPVPVALHIVAGALDGLAYAHTRKDAAGKLLNLVHRDVSPENILLSYEGDVKVVDFGIAKTTETGDHTAAGMVRGKYPYLSPEQASGDRDLDARTDLWAAGVILFDLLCGRRPFEGEFLPVMREVISGTSVPTLTGVAPGIDPALEAIVLGALKRDRTARYPSARDFSAALTAYLHERYPTSTRQDIQSLLLTLFKEEAAKEGVDTPVPPDFAAAMAGAGAKAMAPPPRPVAAPPVPTRLAPTEEDDSEATVSLGKTEKRPPLLDAQKPSFVAPLAHAVPWEDEKPKQTVVGPVGLEDDDDAGDDDAPTQAGLPMLGLAGDKPPKKPSGKRKGLPARDVSPAESLSKPTGKKTAPVVTSLATDEARAAPTSQQPGLPSLDGPTQEGIPLAALAPGPDAPTDKQGIRVPTSQRATLGTTSRPALIENQRKQLLIGGAAVAIALMSVAVLVIWRGLSVVEAPTQLQVQIVSVPPGGAASVDGRPAGRTPTSVLVAPGEHTVKVELAGFNPWSRTVTALVNEPLNLRAELEALAVEGGPSAAADAGTRRVAPTAPPPDDANQVSWPRRFLTLRLKHMALPLDEYATANMELNPKTAYSFSISGTVSLGPGRATSTLLYYLDGDAVAGSRFGLLSPRAVTVKGASRIRVFAIDDAVADNAGTLAVMSRISQYVPERTLLFDAKKHAVVPKPGQQFRLEGLSASAEYLLTSRSDLPALKPGKEGLATSFLCLTEGDKPRSLSRAAHLIKIGAKVVLDDAEALQCLIPDDTVEDDSGSIELDVVDSAKARDEGIDPSKYSR